MNGISLVSFLVCAMSGVDAPASQPVDVAASQPAVIAPPAASAPPVQPSSVLLPAYGLAGFDAMQMLWGPGRRSSGDSFHSAAELLPEGALRLRGNNWSLGFGGQIFIRSELRDNNDFNKSASDFNANVDHRVRLSLRGSLFNRVGTLIEFQDVRPWGTERSTMAVEPLTGLHQGFVDIDATSWLQLRGGRQELCYGDDRLVGCGDWAQSARAFDGLFLRFKLAPWVTLDAFGLVVKNFQRYSRTLGDGSTQAFTNTGNYLTGIYVRLRPMPAFSADVYALGYVEDPATAESGAKPSNVSATLGARAVGKIAGLTLTGEGAFQTGRSNNQLVLAGAFAARAVYALPVFGAPYVLFDVVAASGDGDAADGVQHNFNQLFPTAHAHLGYADYVAWSNVIDVHAAMGWKPRGVHVWVDYHHFRYWDPRGRWLNAAGAVFLDADPLRTAPVMGNEVDVSVTVPITLNLAVASAFSLFLPGAGAEVAGGSTIGKGRDLAAWGFLYLRGQL